MNPDAIEARVVHVTVIAVHVELYEAKRLTIPYIRLEEKYENVENFIKNNYLLPQLEMSEEGGPLCHIETIPVAFLRYLFHQPCPNATRSFPLPYEIFILFLLERKCPLEHSLLCRFPSDFSPRVRS